MWTYNPTIPSDELYHYGIKGMKWGHRKARLFSTTPRQSRPVSKPKNNSTNNSDRKKSTAKKVAIGVAATAAIIGAVYGATKLNKVIRDKNESIRIGEQLVKADRFINRESSQINKMGGSNSNFDSFVKKSLRSDAVSTGIDAARNDSFATAVSNVYRNYRNNRR